MFDLTQPQWLAMCSLSLPHTMTDTQMSIAKIRQFSSHLLRVTVEDNLLGSFEFESKAVRLLWVTGHLGDTFDR